jgi:phosphotransferase system HPr-like phosphotransfer protein
MSIPAIEIVREPPYDIVHGKRQEVNAVKTVMIKLSLVENVNKFVNIVTRYPFEMDLRAGRHVVDAKSILGIFSLDLSRPIALEIYSDDCEALMEEIEPFIAPQE